MKKALLVIDMLDDFKEDGALTIGDGKAVAECEIPAGRMAPEEGGPVIYIMDRHRPDDAEFQMFPPHCIEGERGAEVIAELAPRKEDFLIYKRRYSAFFGTDLDLTLRELEVNELELVGVCTQICVLYTAADARMLNYGVTVRRKCVDSFDREAHRFALREMEKTLGVKVL